MKYLGLMIILLGGPVCGGESASSESSNATRGAPKKESPTVLETAHNDAIPNVGPNDTRLPIIHLGMPKMRANINGPSMIRVPDWIPSDKRASSKANYYLYFANHGGHNIRMAWAEHVLGPYTVYKPGVGVLSRDLGKAHLKLGNHVASPDVHVDDAHKRIIMYFHGAMRYDDQVPYGSHGQHTAVATSPFGLDFNDGLVDMVICPSYARVFHYKGGLYAFTGFGQLWKARDPEHPWTNPPPGRPPVDVVANGGLWERISDPRNRRDATTNPFDGYDKKIRHLALRMHDDKLDVFFSRYGTAPEHIEYATIDLRAGVANWRATQPVSVLMPTQQWEGADLPIKPSGLGGAGAVHQLRDPYVFKDRDGKEYLLYSARGEESIGIVPLADVLKPSGANPR